MDLTSNPLKMNKADRLQIDLTFSIQKMFWISHQLMIKDKIRFILLLLVAERSNNLKRNNNKSGHLHWEILDHLVFITVVCLKLEMMSLEVWDLLVNRHCHLHQIKFVNSLLLRNGINKTISYLDKLKINHKKDSLELE